MKLRNYRKDIIAICITIVLSIIIVLSSKLIYNNGFIRNTSGNESYYSKAVVIEVVDEKLEDDQYIDDIRLGYQNLTVEVLDGPYKEQYFSVTNNISRLYNTIAKKGSHVILAISENNKGQVEDVYITSFNRSRVLLILIIIFLLSILIVGGFKGLKSIVSLIFTLICVIYLMVPLMLKGINPILSATIIAIISTTVTLMLISGKSRKTMAAIGGTVLGVIIAGVIAFIFGMEANLSGLNMTDTESVLYVAEMSSMKVRGIFYAGILVSALGAVMDVAMSISSSIFEIKSINQGMTVRELFKSGMNIGRDIIGTMSNTLILAFAGGSMNTLILIYSADISRNMLINMDLVGIEIIQGVAGSIGIILTVPITVLLSSILCCATKRK